MATKTISITEEAYKKLARLRTRDNESFSEIINRITKKNDLRKFVGILSEGGADEIKKSLEEIRKIHMKNHTKRASRILRELG